jgi:hypothetical protein|nr:MAG TPA: hypothetical protein [Caudoviricetes sp.]
MANNNTYLLDLMIKRADLEDRFEENTNFLKLPLLWWKLKRMDSKIYKFCSDALMIDVLDNVAEVCKVIGNGTKLYNNMNIDIKLEGTRLAITRYYIGRRMFGSITTSKVEYNTANADSIKYIISRESINETTENTEIKYEYDDDDDFTNHGIRTLINEFCTKLISPDEI